jgi:hypothetical protein
MMCWGKQQYMGTCHFNDPDQRFTWINSGKLRQYIKEKWELEDSSYCGYNIVATLGTPVSGKSKCILTRLPHKLVNKNQPRFSMIYLVPTLLAVMPMAMWIGPRASQHGQLNNAVYITNTFVGVWISKAKDADILVMDCDEVTMQKKQAEEASSFVSCDIMIQLMWISINTDRNDD